MSYFLIQCRDLYQLMRVGWKGLKRVYYTVLHFNIKDGKIWLQQNTTDIDVGQELLEFGIPKEDSLGLTSSLQKTLHGLWCGLELLDRTLLKDAIEGNDEFFSFDKVIATHNQAHSLGVRVED